MVHEEKKVAKIIEELTMFFFTLGADEIHSGISRDGNRVEITFDANGGSDITSVYQIATNQTYGELPIPTREDYKFL